MENLKILNILATPALFVDLLSFPIENKSIDLHNDYNCINFLFENQTITFVFQKINKESKKLIIHNELQIIFINAQIIKMNFDFSDIERSLTLDNFYRGRFLENEILVDETQDNKSCFYIEFYEGVSFEVLAKNIAYRLINP